jgi:uncharacterized membrane protein
LTGELKSACSSAIRPETWLPTCTVTMAERVPLAVTLATIRPRSSLAVSIWVLGLLPELPRQITRAATRAAAVATRT